MRRKCFQPFQRLLTRGSVFALAVTVGLAANACEQRSPTQPESAAPSSTASSPNDVSTVGTGKAATTATAATQALPSLPSMEYPIRGLKMAYTGCSTATPEQWKYSVVWSGSYDAGVVCEGRGTHSGVDVPLPPNTPVYSMADGVIVAVNRFGARGKTPPAGVYVIVKHEVLRAAIGGTPPPPLVVYAAYFHLTQGTVPAHFANGVRVRKGEYIGGSGNTGDTRGATGQHLHFQIENDNGGAHPYYSSSQTVSPMRFIDQHRWDWVR